MRAKIAMSTPEPVLLQNKMGANQVLLTREDLERDADTPVSINLECGGKITLIPEVLKTEEERDKIKNEVLKESSLFRQYELQTEKEPRNHFLLHENAEDKQLGTMQPGYRYGGITMKAHNLQLLPKVATFAKDMEEISKKHLLKENSEDHSENDDEGSKKVAFWSLGVDVVFYKSGRDYIGMHSDNAQHEKLICTALIHCDGKRKIVIKSNDNAETLTLLLRPGDVYVMDAEMQKHYKHGVPKVGGKVATSGSRLALVFRRGKQMDFLKDSGESVQDLTPRNNNNYYIFGRLPIQMTEGMTFCWKVLKHEFHHTNIQAGVNGNVDQGCGSITVGVKATADDCLFRFKYTARKSFGAERLAKSWKQQLPIRVFRTSKGESPFAPPCLINLTTTYRYDGLYFVQEIIEESNSDDLTFQMVRVKKGDSIFENLLDESEFLSKCFDLKTMKQNANLELDRIASANASQASCTESLGKETQGNIDKVKTKKKRKRLSEAERLKDALSPDLLQKRRSRS